MVLIMIFGYKNSEWLKLNEYLSFNESYTWTKPSEMLMLVLLIVMKEDN